jgi:hypothetical protein
MSRRSDQVAVWDRLLDAEAKVRDCTEKGQRTPAIWEVTRNVLQDLYADLYAQGHQARVRSELASVLGEERAVPIKYARMGEHSWVEGRNIEHSGYVEGSTATPKRPTQP